MSAAKAKMQLLMERWKAVNIFLPVDRCEQLSNDWESVRDQGRQHRPDVFAHHQVGNSVELGCIAIDDR